MACWGFLVVLAWSFNRISTADLNNNLFPDDFVFGVATASYQVEGAWNESDKSEDIWNYLTHNFPDKVKDHSNADVSCDSYHHINDDVAMLKNLNVDFYRFSIAWTRLLPNAFDNKISTDGLAYYNKLIDTLIANDITPLVTIYHWDLPNILQKLGGWTNPKLVDYYTDYARILFEQFGDRVKHWLTFNEPQVFCEGYGGGNKAPANFNSDGIGNYLCLRTMLLSHATTYRLYNETYKPTQQGQCGITLSSIWFEPNSTSAEDAAAADRAMQFTLGAFAHPIFSKDGDYPDVVKEAIANRSSREGFPYSRLPTFTSQEVEFIKGTADFFGLNHYSSNLTTATEAEIGEPSYSADMFVSTERDPEWETSTADWLQVVPWGFTKILLWIKEQYGNPKILITENGFADSGELDDSRRINYYQQYLSALLDAMDQGVNVVGYTAWSLMDNFEWMDGFTVKFGLYHVNMSDPARPRTPKASAEYFKNVITTRSVITSSSSSSMVMVSSGFSVCLLLLTGLFS